MPTQRDLLGQIEARTSIDTRQAAVDDITFVSISAGRWDYETNAWSTELLSPDGTRFEWDEIEEREHGRQNLTRCLWDYAALSSAPHSEFERFVQEWGLPHLGNGQILSVR